MDDGGMEQGLGFADILAAREILAAHLIARFHRRRRTAR
jgi:hypothetical protein